jgi:transposase InsO family protein
MERKIQPRLGGRKLLHMLTPTLNKNDVKVGRDRFFEILRDEDMLVKRKPGKPRTTNSRHSLPIFPNLVPHLIVTGPNMLWVADITYIRTEEGFLYAALITDAFSRKIVGAHINDTLEAEGCLTALEEALAALPSGSKPTHHSDRGCQYCCHAYVERLQAGGFGISMTEVSHCYENAMAERVNGILKQEYELDRTFQTKEQARKAFKQAIFLYNHRRPHLALNFAIPIEIHEKAA